MREFFKGWRRKVGCVALVVASLFMIWINDPAIVGFSIAVTDVSLFEDRHAESHDYNVEIPNWSTIIILSLLSAYLILWRPRKKPKPGSATNA
ncbi:MAG: hypothetical protein JSS49_00015 [Planctomycetes bacterium]|nr:hypothetical protein [Planctomycetota bacterium]